jgi:heme-degrading monooxygenase HmoA
VIVVIVHHWCKPGMIESARLRIDENGADSARAPGFLFRYRLEKPDEPNRVSTVSGWTSRAAYRAWKDARSEADQSVPATAAYERWVNEIFEVEHSHDAVPAAVQA